ncbi:MAG: tyrosine-protein phosphatase [Lactobacillus sp.]|uniref:tyrosine-protein phosphatase n=1 Tax=Bombilactobacillus bombi TaxID=1303590 RepID=UPI0035E7CB1D|nr:tyrosine-protein phosphatase [Lactobacillus sp.]
MQRIFDFSQTYNFRELGGYPTKDQRQIRSHKVMRAAYLSKLTPVELQQLKDYGLRYSIDLRSDYERQQWPDPPVDFLTSIHLPLYAANGISDKLYYALPAKDQYSDLPGIYQQVVLDHHAQQVFRQFFAILLRNEQPGQSVVFHCSAGKDRTGIMAILFLLIMQVPTEYITQDYLLSNLMYQNKIDLNALNNPDDATIKKMNFTKADQSAVEAIQVAILDIYQSWDNFQEKVLGLSVTDYQKLRNLYTAPIIDNI